MSLDRGSSHLVGRLIGTSGQSVTYRRGVDSVTVTAVLTDTNKPLADSDGYITQVVEQSFVIKVSDLKFGTQSIEPQRDDRIQFVRNGRRETYTVFAMPNESPFKRIRSDGYSVFTKLVHSESA